MRNGLDPFLPIATFFFFFAALFSSPFFLYLDNVVHSLLFAVCCAPPFNAISWDFEFSYVSSLKILSVMKSHILTIRSHYLVAKNKL